MDLFDLHCDTITECYNRKCNLDKNDLAIDLKKAENIEKWVQTFAFFIPDNMDEHDGFEYFINLNRYYDNLKIKNYKQDTKGLSGIKMVENGKILGKDLHRIESLVKNNVKIVTLTWNGENQIASGSQAYGGLKAFGRDVVKKLETNNIVIDLSHLNEESFYDIMRASTKPKIATHSNAYTVKNHPRNLKDEQIKEIKAIGGIIGLNFYQEFVGKKEDKIIENLIKHAEHIMKVGDEKILAIGSDFDGARMSAKLKDISQIHRLYDEFRVYFGNSLADNIFYNNAKLFFENNFLC